MFDFITRRRKAEVSTEIEGNATLPPVQPTSLALDNGIVIPSENGELYYMPENGYAWVSLNNSPSISNVAANSYSTLDAGIDGTVYYHHNQAVYDYMAAEGIPEKEIAFAFKLLYENYCKMYPEEVETWEMQLILNNNDYTVTVPYIIQYLQDKQKKAEV